ncbi:hypothetical protein BDW69DRAFT_192267 [Aspergillus filifer]
MDRTHTAAVSVVQEVMDASYTTDWRSYWRIPIVISSTPPLAPFKKAQPETDPVPMTTYEEFLARKQGLGEVFLQRMLEDPSSTAIEPIGIVIQHGILDVYVQLAIIYAGGTCVPIDPKLPNQQIERRLNRLETRCVLVDESNSGRELPFSQLLVEDIISASIPLTEANTYPVKTGLDHRTHLIHTSGTTSEPKAVQIVARSIMHVSAHAPFEPVLKSDVLAHHNSTSFDVSLFDIWAALLQGASIAVLDKPTLLDVDSFAAAIKRYKISAMTITAPLVNLCAATRPDTFSSMRVVLMGGEAVNIGAMRKIFQAGPPEHMLNAYGPTECCMYCLVRKIVPDDLHKEAVSIGYPIGSNIAVACDESGNVVADGEEGELLVGGPGVSPGYFNNPSKNAAAFINIPGLVDSNGRPYHMYRTGDIVKRRADGQHDFVGRRDHQVKIRGYRVELGAIESVMMQTGYFTEVLAMGVESKIESGAASSAVGDALAALKAALPPYMMPHVQPVDRIPLNSHAKVDRQQLKEAYYQRQSALKTVSYTKARSTTREQLAALWATILALYNPNLSDNDDFFSLGGSSLQASLLISLIKRTFQTKVSLLALYDNPTLGQLATLIDSHQGRELDTVRNLRETWIADTMIGDGLEPPESPVVDWLSDMEGRVFLTGATGFVGTFLLAEMLRMPYIHQVGCLVRASDTTAGLQRLRRSLTKYDLWKEEYQHKLLVFCGKLEDTWLGLGAARYREIAHWSSVIFHLGALVNYTQPYSWHRPANVQGTLNIVRLAVTGRVKGLHYCSSVSCFGPTGSITGAKLVLEDGPLLPHLEALPYDHGYAQSQWVAEELLNRLRDRRFPIAVYRPGFITGHSVTGACNPDDFFSRLIRACSGLGCYPELPNQRKEFVTVDYVVSAMMLISSCVFSLGHAFHIVPYSRDESPDMDTIMQLVSQSSGQRLDRVSYEEWIDRLSGSPSSSSSSSASSSATPPISSLSSSTSLASSESIASLQPLLPMLAEKVRDGLSRWELYEDMPTYDTTNTERAVMIASYRDRDAARLPFPVIDATLMKRYLEYLATH